MTVALHHGDCREVLPTLAADSVEACVTDPPYHLTTGKKGGTGVASLNPNSPAGRSVIGTGFMGKAWDGGDIAQDSAMWSAVLRVLKPGAHLAAFGGTRTFHRMMCAIEDAGFEIRDTVMWVYSTGFPKSFNLDGEWQGWGSALKPSFEPIVLARKPLIGTIAANVARYGTGAINIAVCRIPSTIGQLPNGDDEWASDESLCSSCAEAAGSLLKPTVPATRASTATKGVAPTTSGRAQISLLDIDRPDTGCSDGTMAGAIATSSSIDGSGSWPTGQSQPSTKSTTSTATRVTTDSQICSSCGRPITGVFTVNSISPERMNSPHGPKPSVSAGREGEPSASRRYTDNGSTNFAATPGPRGGSDLGRWPPNLAHDGSPEVLAAFAAFGERAVSGAAQTGRKNPNGVEYQGGFCGHAVTGPLYNDTGTAARFFYTAKSSTAERNIGHVGDERSTHPTVKPLSLMSWLCRLVTPSGGTILDPFAGSGSTLVAADREGFNAIGIELDAEYLAIARRRVAGDCPLFADLQ